MLCTEGACHVFVCIGKRSFTFTELKECLKDNSIAFQAADPLPNDDIPTPYIILGDDAFGLRTYLMKPYALRQMTKDQRIFNYRLSRGRRIVENAFGILAQHWQILLTTMQHNPMIIVETCHSSQFDAFTISCNPKR